jgi:superfamily II DNA or RNA helicase
MYDLEEYQEQGVQAVAAKLAAGAHKIVRQLPTGGGKTVEFSGISYRYSSVPGRGAVLILVHRRELLLQTRKTLYKGFGVIAQPIIAGMRHVPDADVYVGMIETVNRRIANIAPKVGLVIIDECHYQHFNKIHKYFPHAKIVGYTATPLTGDKKNPLKDFYEDIVCNIDIPDLIALNKVKPHRGLVQNVTFVPKEHVDRSDLVADGGGNDYDEGLMALQFSKPQYIKGVVDAYENPKYGTKGTKAIVFNINRAHSKLVMAEFKARGYDVRHLDAESDNEYGKGYRKKTLEWFEKTPGAILCNVDILTAGFDEPSIETVIVNRATMSLAKWLQMCGRGSRPYLFEIMNVHKSLFTIIDMGANALVHGDWCDPRNWPDIFFNPPKPSDKKSVPPVKDCPRCEAIVPAQTRTCPHCGYQWPIKEAAPEGPIGEFVAVTKGIDVKAVIARNRDRKEHAIFLGIGTILADQARNFIPEMSDQDALFILDQYHVKAQEWAIEANKQYNDWYKQQAKEHLFKQLKKKYPTWLPRSITR